jgi:hypothetical protein
VSGADTSGVRPVSQTRTSEYHVREDGIIVQTLITTDKLSLEHARANSRLFEQLADGEQRRLLVDIASAAGIEPEVRNYYASDEGSRWIAALAVVTPSILARVLGNLSLRLKRLGYPCRIFGSTDAAVAWLLRQPARR